MSSDLINAPAATPATAPADAAPFGTAIDLARLGSTGASLVEQARDVGAALAAAFGHGDDSVATARLESAALDFAREARALHVGNPDTPAAERAGAIDAALAIGEASAAALSSVGFDAVDRAVTTLDAAAYALGDMQAPALHQPAPSEGS